MPFSGAVLKHLQRHCADAHLAEDLAQETLLRAARSRTRIADLDRPVAWLIRIATNLAKDTAERASRDRLVPATGPGLLGVPGCEPIPGEDPAGAYFDVGDRKVSSSELGEWLRRVWPELPDRDQKVLSAYYFEGKSARETASPYGTPPALGKVWLFRARRRLEGLLRERVSMHG